MSQYATVQEFKTLGLPAAALEELTEADIEAQLQDASGIIDLHLSSRYTLPLVAPFPDALRRFCVCIATFHILLRRGYNPEEFDAGYSKEHDDCLELLERIAKGDLTIPGIEDQTPTVSEGRPRVSTQPLRGW